MHPLSCFCHIPMSSPLPLLFSPQWIPQCGKIYPDNLKSLNGVFRGGVNLWVKGSVCFILKFAFPRFSPLYPLRCKSQNKTGTDPLTQGLTPPLYVNNLMVHPVFFCRKGKAPCAFLATSARTLCYHIFLAKRSVKREKTERKERTWHSRLLAAFTRCIMSTPLWFFKN